jgi:hypothetical protein
MTSNLTPRHPLRNTPHYQDPEDIPEQYADIVDELRNEVLDIRLTYIQKRDDNRQPGSGNAAAAKLEMVWPWMQKEYSTSTLTKICVLAVTLPAMTTLKPGFPTFKLLYSTSSHIPRDGLDGTN